MHASIQKPITSLQQKVKPKLASRWNDRNQSNFPSVNSRTTLLLELHRCFSKWDDQGMQVRRPSKQLNLTGSKQSPLLLYLVNGPVARLNHPRNGAQMEGSCGVHRCHCTLATLNYTLAGTLLSSFLPNRRMGPPDWPAGTWWRSVLLCWPPMWWCSC